MQLLAYGFLALAILGALGGIGYKVRQAGYDAAVLECRAAAEEIRKAEQDRATKAATKKEKGDAKARIVYRTIKQEVEKVVDRVEYVQRACLDDAGLRLAQCAINGGTCPDPAKPDGALRATPPTDGRLGKDDSEMDRR